MHLLSVFMAALVFYGGAGINVFSYCCQECSDAGINALLNDKCCEIHHHDHAKEHHHKHESSASCCDLITQAEDLAHTFDCCNMERIDFDWSSQNADELKIDISPVVLDLFSNNFIDISSSFLLYNNEITSVMPNGPPLVLPCDYLSILTVLLI